MASSRPVKVQDLQVAARTVWASAGEQMYPAVWRKALAGGSFAKAGVTPNRSGTLDVHGAVAYVVGNQGAGPVPTQLDVYRSPPTAAASPALPCANSGRVLVESAAVGVATDGTVLLVCDTIGLGSAGRLRQLAFTSTDQGRSWTATAGLPERIEDVAATRHARFAWADSLYVSKGGGWTVSLKGNGFATVGFQDDQHGVALGRDHVLHLTEDAGRTWGTAAF